MSESRRKEFGGKGNRVWAEVIKSRDGKITTAFGSESEVVTEKGSEDPEQVIKDTRKLVGALEGHIETARKWAETNAAEMTKR